MNSSANGVVGRIAALYRYPVKGLTPEPCDALWIRADGRVEGDRVLGLRFANTEVPDDDWSHKSGMLALVNTPGLARLAVQFDATAGRLRLGLGGATLSEESLAPPGRARVAEAVATYAQTLDINPLRDHPERLPLRLVGDGTTPRYHDNAAGEVTLLGRGSLAALGGALGMSDLSALRFRPNIVIEGPEAWAEQAWIGREIRIGDVGFRVTRPKVRCLATHANPDTGERDQPILTTLTGVFGHEKPTIAVAMLPSAGPGQVHVGDDIVLTE